MSVTAEEVHQKLDAELVKLLAFAPVPVPGAAGSADVDLEGGWSFVKELEGVKIYRMKPEDMPVYFMKGTTVINAPYAKVTGMAWDTPTRKTWDDLYIESHIVQVIDDNTSIEHSAFSSGAPLVSSRDFLLARRKGTIENGGGSYIVARSVEHQDCPPNTGKHVRGEIYSSGFVFRPAADNENKTFATYVVAVNPKGSIPGFVVNMVSTKQPTALGKLRNAVEKQ
eukprot:ANDGO_02536.mRNA.1 hypothetical protein AMSG_08085